MRRVILCLFSLALFSSQVGAHSVPVQLSATLEGQSFVLTMHTPDGWPINGAKIEAMLLREDGDAARLTLQEFGSQGRYRAAKPDAKPGTYTLLFRDSTFKSESLEVKQRVQWPLSKPVELLLPASQAGGADWPVVLTLTALPVVLALAVLGFVVLRKPREAAGIK